MLRSVDQKKGVAVAFPSDPLEVLVDRPGILSSPMDVELDLDLREYLLRG